MGITKRMLEEEMEKRLCPECNKPVEKEGKKWFCPKCEVYYEKECPNCPYVFNPRSEDEISCSECYERALERME